MFRRGNPLVRVREEASSTCGASHLRAGLSLSWPSHVHIQPNLLKSCHQSPTSLSLESKHRITDFKPRKTRCPTNTKTVSSMDTPSFITPTRLSSQVPSNNRHSNGITRCYCILAQTDFSITWAINSTYHTTLQATPGQHAFQRDMIMPTTYLANWATIQHRCQEQSIDSTTKENSSRIRHECHLNDRVLIRRGMGNPYLGKLARPTDGPYKIIDIAQLPINGTVLIQRTANSTECVNIRRLVPFFEPSH